MRKVALLLVALLAAAGGWFFWQNFQIEGLQDLRLVRPHSGAPGLAAPAPDESAAGPHSDITLRIGTLHLNAFGDGRASKPQVLQTLARVARRFDILAVQDIRSRNQHGLRRWLELINADGQQYDYVIGPQVGRDGQPVQFAFLFDRARVELDRQQLYTLGDPHELLHREPLVGWFRARDLPAEQAFTFTLVNMHLDPDELRRRPDVLAQVYRAVRDDGRGEDDVILLGTFHSSDRRLEQLGRSLAITCALGDTPTDTRGRQPSANLLLQAQATSEFTGQAGVFDFLRQYNLTLQEALEVSEHLPVWAEFSIYEGGAPGLYGQAGGRRPAVVKMPPEPPTANRRS